MNHHAQLELQSEIKHSLSANLVLVPLLYDLASFLLCLDVELLLDRPCRWGSCRAG